MSTTTNKSLRISIMGTRGIPANYGGFETFAEELSTRLASRGHKVTVYGRSFFGEPLWQKGECRGVSTVKTPTVRHKYGETPLHAFTSFLHGVWRKITGNGDDIILLCNAANSPFAWILRAALFPVAINVDGIERKRTKWNAFGRAWYRLGELSSVLFASEIVADAQVIAEYYKERFHTSATVIAYGATAVNRPSGPVLEKFGLSSRGYILYVSRLEPENNALGVIEAHYRSGIEMPLVIVGDAPYASEYKKQLYQAAGERVIFTGYQFGEAYQELQSNCFTYIQATEVGGTHPALIESMAYGNCVIANGTPENREVLGDTGLFYAVNDFSELADHMRTLVGDRSQVESFRHRAKARASECYQWERITDQYEDLFFKLTGNAKS